MAFGTAPAKPADGNYRSTCIGFAVLSLVLAVLLGGYILFDRMGRETARNKAQYLLDEQKRAWNAGDLPGFTATYRLGEDVTLFSDGRLYKGWEQLNDRYRAMYGGRAMGELIYEDISIEVLASDAALVRGRWTVKSDVGTRAGLFTMLARSFPEGWKIVHDHMTIGELR